MELNFRKVFHSDCEIVFTALFELQDKPLFTLKMFESYWGALISGEFGKYDIWLAFHNEKACAYILANHYPMPRYMGQGIELEEVVTLPAYQRKGIGKLFIQFLFEYYSSKSSIRKITIKTDDHKGAGKLYNEFFGLTDMGVYHKFLNKL